VTKNGASTERKTLKFKGGCARIAPACHLNRLPAQPTVR
jgi:hypothetical protein